MTTDKPSAPEVVAILRHHADLFDPAEGDAPSATAAKLRQAADTIEALQRRVAELEADAARYRLLRDYDANWRYTELVVVKNLDGGHIFTLEELDAAIDAARGERDAPAAKEEG